MHVACCKSRKCWPGRRIPHLNGTHCGVAEGFFGDQLRSPKVVKTGVLDHAATAFFSSFDGSVGVSSESVLLGLKLLFGSTQRPHFFFKPDGGRNC